MADDGGQQRVVDATTGDVGVAAAAAYDPKPSIADNSEGLTLEERLAFIRSLWTAKRTENSLPQRADLDPGEFHRLWPVTFLLEKSPDDGEWYVRFAGAAYGSVYGQEITGARVRDIVPEGLATHVLDDLRRCADGREPIVMDGETNWPDRGNVYRYQRVLLPYGNEDGEVTHLLGVAAFFNSVGATVF